MRIGTRLIPEPCLACGQVWVYQFVDESFYVCIDCDRIWADQEDFSKRVRSSNDLDSSRQSEVESLKQRVRSTQSERQSRQGGQAWEPRGISGVIGVLFTIGAILVAVFFASSCVVCTFAECGDGTERRDGDPRFPVH